MTADTPSFEISAEVTWESLNKDYLRGCLDKLLELYIPDTVANQFNLPKFKCHPFYQPLECHDNLRYIYSPNTIRFMVVSFYGQIGNVLPQGYPQESLLSLVKRSVVCFTTETAQALDQRVEALLFLAKQGPSICDQLPLLISHLVAANKVNSHH